MNKVQINIYHDTRRAKADGNVYPVKIRVWDGRLQERKLFPTPFDLSKKDFDAAWHSQKVRKEYQDLHFKLHEIRNRAIKLAESISPFSFDVFEKKMYQKIGDGNNVFYQIQEYVKELKKEKRIKTAQSYEQSENSLKKFIKHKTNREKEVLLFEEVTVDFLKEYEAYRKELGRKINGTGIYLRNVRKIFNDAVKRGDISIESYPFAKGKYIIPKQRGIKKALDNSQLKLFFEAIPKNIYQEKARDFWFLSYNGNGMNIKDMLLLKYKDVDGDEIVFYRSKTINTTRKDMKPIKIIINDYIRKIIDKYGDENTAPDNYIIPVMTKGDSEELMQKKIQNFTRFINQHIKKLAKSVGVTEGISVNYARHSFATKSIRGGGTMLEVGESLGHGSDKTTREYFAGLEDKVKRELSDKLMDFE